MGAGPFRITENAIRVVAVARKNFLFSDIPQGAEASALVFSIISTAAANGLDPYEYLVRIFRNLPNLDFPYEIEKRYRKMVKEDGDYAELIYDCLVEEGTNRYDDLSDAEFVKLIRKQYKYIMDVASEGFF